eukprot:4821348-Pyramimonas_sp.AAC.1
MTKVPDASGDSRGAGSRRKPSTCATRRDPHASFNGEDDEDAEEGESGESEEKVESSETEDMEEDAPVE